MGKDSNLRPKEKKTRIDTSSNQPKAEIFPFHEWEMKKNKGREGNTSVYVVIPLLSTLLQTGKEQKHKLVIGKLLTYKTRKNGTEP